MGRPELDRMMADAQRYLAYFGSTNPPWRRRETKMDPDPLASAETITLMRRFSVSETRIEFLDITG